MIQRKWCRYFLSSIYSSLKVENPTYQQLLELPPDHPIVEPFSAVAFELFTLHGDLSFDNILITTDFVPLIQ